MLAFFPMGLMLTSIRLATVVFLATACLQPASFAQTKQTPPPPSQQPAPPPQPQPAQQPKNQPASSSTIYSQPATQESPYNTELKPSWMDDKKNPKVGQGSIYAPEGNVPREPLREYRKGLKALEKKDIKAAEQHLLRATELYSKFSSAFNALGYAYQLDPEEDQSGLNPAAKNAFLRALELNPNNENALVNLGYVLIVENKSVEAERVLRRAIAIHSGTTRAYAGLMLAETLQLHFTDVLVTAKKIPNGGENKYPIIFYLRAIAWQNKPDPVQAARDYRDFLKRSPDAAQAELAQTALKELETGR